MRAPPEVPALDDPVELVVALGPVLRLPQLARLGIEGEAETVPQPVRPHTTARERVTA